MNILKKFVVAGAAGLFLTACGGGTLEADLEAVFPEDAGAVFVMDYSDEAQIEKFEALKAQFPETGMWEDLFGDVEKEDRERVKNVKKILDGTWKIGGAIKEVSDSDPDFFEYFYVAGKFSEPDAVQELIEEMINEWGENDGVDFKYSEDGDVQFWTNESEDFYLVRELDLFFLTNKLEERDAVLARLETNVGFNKGNYDDGENLGYVYLEGGKLELFQSFYDELGMGDVSDYFAVMGDMYAEWFADEGGIRMTADGGVERDENFEKLFGDISYKLSLVDQVNAEGVFSYSEQNNFKPMLDSIVQSASMGYEEEFVLDGAEADAPDSPLISPNIPPNALPVESPERKTMEFLKSFGGLSDDEVDGILQSPFAVALSDLGGLVPGMALYLSLDENEVEAAKKMVAGFDDYIVEILKSLGGQLAAFGVTDVNVDELFVNEVKLVNGGAFHKVSLNLETLPEEFITGFSQGFGADVSALSLELWYGITGGNVMVVALESGFDERFGQNVLSEDAAYKEAVADVSKTYGYMVNYMRVQPILDMVDRYAELFKWEQTEKVKLYLDEFVPLFKYFVASGAFVESGSGELRSVSDGYVRIGK